MLESYLIQLKLINLLRLSFLKLLSFSRNAVGIIFSMPLLRNTSAWILLRKILQRKAKIMKANITKKTIRSCTKRIAELKNSERLSFRD